MYKLYIVGGQQKDRITEDWRQYKKGVILVIDADQCQVLLRHEYASRPEVNPDRDPSVVFKAGTVRHNELYVCTEREIVVYSLPNLVQTHYLTLPCFNDVHHVRPHNGHYLIANTGLDMVVEASPSGKVLRLWNVLGEPPWKRFSPSIDYRKVPTTKPHRSHPNYVFTIGDDIWATRCLQMDAVCLTQSGRRIAIGGAYIHDGVTFGDTIYFTRVDGHVVTVDANTLTVKRDYDLNRISRRPSRIGWCRGIKVLDEHQVVVGFTRVRPSRNPLGGKRLYRKADAVLPTRIACYNLTEGKLRWEVDLEQYDMHAVFSIHGEEES